MNDEDKYFLEDIEEFLKIDEEEQLKNNSQTMEKLLSVKDKIKIFNNISSYELQSIIYDLKFIRVNYKDYLYEQGDNTQEIYFIIEGECQAFNSTKELPSLGAGETFGETGAIFNRPRMVSIICSSEKATLLSFKIDQENMEFCSEGLANIYKNLALELSIKLGYLSDTIKSNK